MAFRSFFRIHRVGTTVRIDVDTGLLIERPVFQFPFDMNGEAAAVLMAAHLDRKMDKLVEFARRDAYEAGYKAGRGKKAKADWQPSRLGWDA